MNRPFNDQPIETLIDQNLVNGGTVLDLRLKYIGDDGVEFLSNCAKLVSLRDLNLERNDITDKGIQILAGSTILTGIKSLNLERNSIGDDGVRSIALSPSFSRLTSLNLWENEIGSDGAKAIADSPMLGNLQRLDLAKNKIGDDGDGIPDLAVGAYKSDGNNRGEVKILFMDTDGSRSEERRVGKECRSRWSPYH